MHNIIISTPESSEYASYYGGYVSLVKGNDIISALQGQIKDTSETLLQIPDEKAKYRYAEDKWSIKEW